VFQEQAESSHERILRGERACFRSRQSSHERILRGERAGFRSRQSQATRGF
jgi:hypothetical protein